jgi:hypothetical protein
MKNNALILTILDTAKYSETLTLQKQPSPIELQLRAKNNDLTSVHGCYHYGERETEE